MAEYIERKAVKKMLENAQIISNGEYSGYCTEDINIDDIPAADVAPVVYGEIGYRNRPEHYDSYKLSGQTENGEPLYKREHHIFANYCPLMRGKDVGGKIDEVDKR